MHSRIATLLLLISCALMASCKGGPQPHWVEVRANSIDSKDLHEKCLMIVQQVDLRVAESDADKGEITSVWDEHLVPFYRPRGEGNGGFRRRAHIEIKDADLTSEEKTALAEEGKTNPRMVRVRVEKEFNDERKRPGDSKSAKWEPDEDDSNFAAHIAVMIQNQVEEFKPSNDFNNRFGGDPQKKSKNGNAGDTGGKK
ncbi:MAG: hypothetical protein HY286_13180 [Planctomycetes bacterium]|nr:hypothetical protein [Planctomycetota bacterium]